MLPIESALDGAVSFGVNAGSNPSSEQIPGDHSSPTPSLQPESSHPVQYNPPIQYDAVVPERGPEGGERRLLLAVLKDALKTYIKNIHGRTARARREFDETRRWFCAENQEGIFAFEHLCEALNIDPDPLRRWFLSLHTGDDSAQLCRRTSRRRKTSQKLEGETPCSIRAEELPLDCHLDYYQP